MKKLLSKCLKDLRAKEEKVVATDSYLKQLEYLNKVNAKGCK